MRMGNVYLVFGILVAMVTPTCCHRHRGHKGHRFTLETVARDYHIPDNQKVVYDVNLDPDHHHHHKHHVNRRNAYRNLQIHTHFDYSVESMVPSQSRLIKEKVLKAVRYWEDTLFVQPTRVPIRLNRQCRTNDVRYSNGVKYCHNGCMAITKCGDITVPQTHLHTCDYWNTTSRMYITQPDNQPGIMTDFILYVSTIPSDKCRWQKTVAFAAHCQQEKRLDRPVAGYFSICPHSVSTSIHEHEELLYTIKHEILHALGFTAGLYAFYRDSIGLPLTRRDPYTNKPQVYNSNLGFYQWSPRVVQQIRRPSWRLKGQTIVKTVNMIITPNVVREVRNHFNCSRLEGAELEDQGMNGTAYTHWEKRLFENEFMTGTYTQNPTISRISLALMEDTGWYRVKYSNTGELEWGRNLGCDFVMKSCYEWIETRLNRRQDIHPFCIQANRGQPVTDCTRDRKSVAICNLSEFQRNLPAQYQYFSSIPGVKPSDVGKYGGSVSLADYCPYLQEFVWKQNEAIIRGSRCAFHQNTLPSNHNYLLEKYGRQSKCFNHGTQWQLQQCRGSFSPHSGSGCYEYSCSPITGLTIYIKNTGYRCYYAGQKLRVSVSDYHWYYSGGIVCPPCTEICQELGVVCPADRTDVYRAEISGETPYVPCGTAAYSSAKVSIVVVNVSFILFVISFCTQS